jgi:hypothetical protein
MRENQTPARIKELERIRKVPEESGVKDQYGPFREEEYNTLVLRACKHGATKYEIATFLAWASKAKINIALLNLIERGDVEITGYKDDGTFVVKASDSQGRAPTP